jgi:lipopolysaccharide transport system ATP-binding protein
MEPIIEIKNLGKKYDIQQERGKYIALRDVLANILKHPFRFATAKAKNAVGISKKNEFWALKGVNFTVNRGEIIGIIGANGAGKSTLLKILTGITPPTEGSAILPGHVSSLLEVGTGFHPELTGRENIFLNGAILGMRKVDIEKNFDSIVEFAGIEKFLDTPVKRYSSGMYVRLAFSVAAHIEPDILLVDEVLAVGDAEFQKKCLGKMDEVTKKSGRTILFVSHNMAAIQSLCARSVLIEKGQVAMIGKTNDVIARYLSKNLVQNAITHFPDSEESAKATIRQISILNKDTEPRSELPISEPFSIKVAFECREEISDATVSLLIYSHDRDLLLYSSEADSKGSLSAYAPGTYEATITVPEFLLNVGKYSFDILIHKPNLGMFANARDIGFEIKNIENPRSIIFQGNHPGRIANILKYKIVKK